MKNQRYGLIAGIVAAGVLLGAAWLLFRPAPSAASTTQPVNSTSVGSLVDDPSSFLHAGGKQAIDVSISPKLLNLTRGENGTVTIVLHHISNSSDYPTLHVVAKGSSGMMVLPSFAKNMTAFERSQYIIQGKKPPGLMSLSPYISYSPSAVDIAAGENATITATVNLPKDFPSEMVGKTLQFNPALTITNVKNASPSEQQSVQVFPDYFTVFLEG
ncbi:MAG: hypothetical protein ABI361_09480 [Nitrososphaera sp.]